MENYQGRWRYGVFDGRIASGHIADVYASELPLTADEEITKDYFEEQWALALSPQANSSIDQS